MIRTTDKQKKTLKSLSKNIEQLTAQLKDMDAKKQVYITAILEGVIDLKGEKFNLTKDFDLVEIKED